ncbi:MAG: type secretion system protein, partial [Cryobacterium sp.]|nr:type secretion system protein [Cryobacterium sp.]
MLDRRLALAGRPPAWTIDKILIAKPVFAAGAGLLALVWISSDPVILRIVPGTFFCVLCFFVPELLLYSKGQERQEHMQNAL